MTSELRPAVEVWRQAHQALYWLPKGTVGEQGAAAVIEAYGDQREAKWKALAETLVDALEEVGDHGDLAAVRIARQALTSYKEQRDAS